MLNKTVCIQCINAKCMSRSRWTKEDDVTWDIHGYVVCPAGWKVLVTEHPKCDFALEHMISEKANAE